MKLIATVLIILLLVGCSTKVVVDQDYFVSSVLKNECLVSTSLQILHYNYPFDIITEQYETGIVSCRLTQSEFDRQYQLIGDNKIKLENRFK